MRESVDLERITDKLYLVRIRTVNQQLKFYSDRN